MYVQYYSLHVHTCTVPARSNLVETGGTCTRTCIPGIYTYMYMHTVHQLDMICILHVHA